MSKFANYQFIEVETADKNL